MQKDRRKKQESQYNEQAQEVQPRNNSSDLYPINQDHSQSIRRKKGSLSSSRLRDSRAQKYRTLKKELEAYQLPLFQQNWSIYLQILLLDALEIFGPENWQMVAKYMKTDMTTEDIRDHYVRVYGDHPGYGEILNQLEQFDVKNQQQQQERNKIIDKFVEENYKRTDLLPQTLLDDDQWNPYDRAKILQGLRVDDQRRQLLKQRKQLQQFQEQQNRKNPHLNQNRFRKIKFPLQFGYEPRKKLFTQPFNQQAELILIGLKIDQDQLNQLQKYNEEKQKNNFRMRNQQQMRRIELINSKLEVLKQYNRMVKERSRVEKQIVQNGLMECRYRLKRAGDKLHNINKQTKSYVSSKKANQLQQSSFSSQSQSQSFIQRRKKISFDHRIQKQKNPYVQKKRELNIQSQKQKQKQEYIEKEKKKQRMKQMEMQMENKMERIKEIHEQKSNSKSKGQKKGRRGRKSRSRLNARIISDEEKQSVLEQVQRDPSKQQNSDSNSNQRESQEMGQKKPRGRRLKKLSQKSRQDSTKKYKNKMSPTKRPKKQKLKPETGTENFTKGSNPGQIQKQLITRIQRRSDENLYEDLYVIHMKLAKFDQNEQMKDLLKKFVNLTLDIGEKIDQLKCHL